jgi:hypothetical protein
MIMTTRALLLVLLICSIVQAQERTGSTTAPSDFLLTVYSTADPGTFDPQELAQLQIDNSYYRTQYRKLGYGVVREIRRIDLLAGENTVRFADVAVGIDPTTVSFTSLTAPDSTHVLEQNYEYDMVRIDALLAKFINKQITITRNNRTFKATLLSWDYNSIIYREGDDLDAPLQAAQRDFSTIQFPEALGLNTKPTLVWKIAASQAGKHDAQVSYQTDGLTWRADYNVILNQNDSAADVAAWVTLVNQSGAAYPNAKLKLVAGDVHRVQPRETIDRSPNAMRLSQPVFQESALFEYHLYTLDRITSVLQNTSKQIELFPTRTGVGVTKTYVYYGLPENIEGMIPNSVSYDRNFGISSNKKVDIYLLIQNREANGMGFPLPAGRMRVYKQDAADKSFEFVGEDVIQHTPKDEQVTVSLGSAFDIIGERRQSAYNFNLDERWITESFEIKLRNHKSEPVKVIVKENLLRWRNWEITKSSDKFEKQDFRTIHIPVDVPANEEKIVSYSVKYTW